MDCQRKVSCCTNNVLWLLNGSNEYTTYMKDQVFLITGGSSGIGKATAKHLIAQGAKMAITGRNQEKLDRVAQEIGAYGIHADVTKDKDIDRMYELVLSRFGRLDGLINNAGIGGAWKELDELTREDLDSIYQTNVYGAMLVGAKAAGIFKKQGSGAIVNIASTAGLKGFAKGTVYASSKFALRGMTQCWQAELRPHNVRVMLVNPSEVTTAFGQESREERPEEAKKLTSDEIAHTIVTQLQMDPRGFVPEVTVWATNPW